MESGQAVKEFLGRMTEQELRSCYNIAEQLNNFAFSGKAKFIFTVKEEIGLLGAYIRDSPPV